MNLCTKYNRPNITDKAMESTSFIRKLQEQINQICG